MTSPLVFLVDDDPDFLEINGEVLRRAGWRVETFTHPEAALRRLAELRPDLVVSDLMMNSLDAGFSLARRIKEDPRLAGLPVAIVTAVGSQLGFDFTPRSNAELAALHADAFFEKPIAPDRLLAGLHELLARSEAGGDP